MVAYNKINQFTEDLAKQVHDLSGDALTLALTTTANAPTAASEVLGTLTEITYTNLSARVPTITSCEQTSGTLKLILADLIMTASGSVGPFGAVTLYNDTPTSPANPLIAWWLYGSDISLASTETFTANFDETNGVLTIA